MIKCQSLLLLALILSACAPQYTLTTQVTPPAGGPTACTRGCTLSQATCASNCSLIDRQCAANSFAADAAIGPFSRPFASGIYSAPPAAACYTAPCQANCNQAFAACYTGCGGQVQQTRTCIAHCPTP